MGSALPVYEIFFGICPVDKHSYKSKIEYGVSFTVLVVGIFFIFQALTIDTTKELVGPRTLPMILAISLMLGGIWLGLRAYFNKAGDLPDGYGFLESDLQRIIMVVGCGAFFVLCFWAFGYFTALVVNFVIMQFTFGVRNWTRMILGALVLAIIFQWLFMGIMMLNDPKGVIFDMRPYTNWITGAQ